MQIEPIAAVPFDPLLFGTAANNGQMIAEVDDKNPVVEVFDSLAATVTGRAEIKPAKRSFLTPLLRQLRGAAGD